MNLSDVTSKQLGMMKHALGLDYSRKPYRNYYYTSSNHEGWNDLFNKGFAKVVPAEKEGKSYFFLTYEAVKLIYRKNITEKYYREL
ncbi:hypothetical protein ACEPPU_24350 [Priestia aryabhattai]|uniref:hypothetical protein n=1 Tax=Priestia aryabhattai TaxID=412384 RepID=UPI0035AB6C3F